MYLSGSIKFSFRKRSVQISSGFSDVFAGEDGPCIKQEIHGNSRLKVVSIVFCQEAFFAMTGKNPDELRQLASRAHTENRMPLPMRMASEQLVAENLMGVDKNLFLEAKVLELVSYKLGQLENATGAVACVNKTYAEKIHYAAELLEQQMLDPPGIFDLASQAGLNHNKLTKGFKDTFHFTPFEYLSKIRLRKAAALIASGDQNVSEAAFSVGYSNLSHFAKIFRKEFGVNPSEFS